MQKEKIVLELKYLLSILSFVFIVYPIRRFIVPLLNYLQKEAYLFGMILFFYGGLYMYDFNATRMINDFTNKLVTEDMWFIQWLITPIVPDVVYSCPFMAVYAVLVGVLMIKVYQLFQVAWRRINMLFGDLLLVMLWCYYKIIGNEEESVMLVSSDEAKNKAAMYGIIVLIVGLIIVFVAVKILYLNTYTADESFLIGNDSVPMLPLQVLLP